MTVFYTSDTRLGHKLVAGIRGFWTQDADGWTPGACGLFTRTRSRT